MHGDTCPTCGSTNIHTRRTSGTIRHRCGCGNTWRVDDTKEHDMPASTTVYISIGNSDDKLTQREWSQFYDDVERLLGKSAVQTYGRWMSIPSDQWQNACWCVEIEDSDTQMIVDELSRLAQRWRQESIAWAEAKAEFITYPRDRDATVEAIANGVRRD